MTSTSALEWEGETLQVTISIGATVVQKGDRAASIVQRADAALYKSKNEGRDRVTLL